MPTANELSGNSSAPGAGCIGNARSEAAKARNKTPCVHCQKDKQKCEMIQGGTCVRCSKKEGRVCIPASEPSANRNINESQDKALRFIEWNAPKSVGSTTRDGPAPVEQRNNPAWQPCYPPSYQEHTFDSRVQANHAFPPLANQRSQTGNVVNNLTSTGMHTLASDNNVTYASQPYFAYPYPPSDQTGHWRGQNGYPGW